MRNHIAYAALYANLYAHRAQQAAVNTKDKVIENKREIATLAGTAAVVGVAARVAGFRAGYEFAQSN